VDVGVVVAAQLLLFLRSEGTKRSADIAGGILATDHEANLTRWVGGDGCVGVLGDWEDFLAVLLELGDQWEVEPLVFSYGIVRFKYKFEECRGIG